MICCICMMCMYMHRAFRRLCYTPMMHAEDFAGSGEEEMLRQGFATCPEDRREEDQLTKIS